MAVSFVLRIRNLFPEFLTDAFIILNMFQPARAVSSRSLKSLTDHFDHFLILIQPNCHDLLPFQKSITDRFGNREKRMPSDHSNQTRHRFEHCIKPRVTLHSIVSYISINDHPFFLKFWNVINGFRSKEEKLFKNNHFQFLQTNFDLINGVYHKSVDVSTMRKKNLSCPCRQKRFLPWRSERDLNPRALFRRLLP